MKHNKYQHTRYILAACVAGALSLNACDTEITGLTLSDSACPNNSMMCSDGCVNVQNDNLNCGRCGNVCGTNEGCVNGTCTNADNICVISSQKFCNGSCVDVQSNANYCGNCTTKCKDNESCQSGKCVVGCARNYTLCDGACYNLLRDAEHCGDCNTQCGTNEYCISGECRCQNGSFDCDGNPANGCESKEECGSSLTCASEDLKCDDKCCSEGETCCGDACFDTKNDPMHCGGCNAEPCTSDQKCVEGVCEDVTIECDGDDIACFGACVYTGSDPKNCGSCGNVCGPNQDCEDGECKDKAVVNDCEEPKKMCYGTCTDIMIDDLNCGDCLNACGESEKCIGGVCELQCGELTNCGGVCHDTQTSANHCGDCATECKAGQECRGGTCGCAPGFVDCDGNPANGCEATEAECKCEPGTTQACWRGDESKIVFKSASQDADHKSICEKGTRTCDASGQFWGPCTGGVYPSEMTCNDAGVYIGGDQNCDGVPDTQQECKSKCDLMAGEMSYIGCEYWPVFLPNQPDHPNYFNHTVLVSNPSDSDATVYIFKPEGYNQATPVPYVTKTIKPNGIEIIQLSVRTNYMIDGSGIFNLSYVLRSSVPITVYQFNPWDGSEAYTADASLLLPTNVLGNKYMSVNWTPGYETHTSNTTIIATQPGTTKVTVKVNSNVVSGSGVPSISKNTTKDFNLNRFQILNLVTSEVNGEQTGSVITSDKKVAVYSGMRCSNIPHGNCCCDHLEEMLFPTQAWGKSYFAVPVEMRGTAPDIWRIVASEDNTTVTVPASVGGSFTLNAGQFKQIESTSTFEISANKPISVGQFMVASDYKNAAKGDPAFGLAVPYEQYRSDYSFSVPSSYAENYVTIIVPNDGTLTLDGNSLSTSDFKAIGSSGFKYKYLKIAAGTHHMTGSKEFGLIGYGYSPYISYLYPIGLDLKVINTN